MIRILSTNEIKTSINSTRYRHVIMEDISNQKRVEYVLFENKHPFLWADARQQNYNRIYPGEIKSIELSDIFLNKVKSSLPLHIKSGDVVEIVIWHWSEWDSLPLNYKILRSFEDQIWRFRSFPDKIK